MTSWVQDCGNCGALAMELLQSWAHPSNVNQKLNDANINRSVCKVTLGTNMAIWIQTFGRFDAAKCYFWLFPVDCHNYTLHTTKLWGSLLVSLSPSICLPAPHAVSALWLIAMPRIIFISGTSTTHEGTMWHHFQVNRSKVNFTGPLNFCRSLIYNL